jgi:hypothetical protein
MAQMSLSTTSSSPWYTYRVLEAYAGWKSGKGRVPQGQSAPWSTAAVLPPGRWRVWVPGEGWGGGMGMRLGAEVAFVDRAGVHWGRRGTGELEVASAKVVY